MGFLNSAKASLLKTVGRVGRGAERVAKHYMPIVSKAVRTGVKLANQYAPVAQRLIKHVGGAAAGVAGVAGAISSGNIAGGIASGKQVFKSVKGAVREVKSAIKKRKPTDRTQTFGKLPKEEGGGGRMTGDFVSEMKKSSGST